MGNYASNNFDAYQPAPCPRCGHRPHIEWTDSTTRGDAVRTYKPNGRRWCETPGCVDEAGSNRVPWEQT
jgi:hypothetical protein